MFKKSGFDNGVPEAYGLHAAQPYLTIRLAPGGFDDDHTRTFVLCLSAALLAIAVGAQSLPLAGTWRANIAKSKYDPGPPPKVPGTLTWERVAGGWRFTTDGVDAQGQKTHTEREPSGGSTIGRMRIATK